MIPEEPHNYDFVTDTPFPARDIFRSDKRFRIKDHDLMILKPTKRNRRYGNVSRLALRVRVKVPIIGERDRLRF